MSRLNALPSFVLNLSFKIRLGLTVASALIFLLVFLLLPAPALLCVPVVVSTWLFRARGLLLCAASLLLTQLIFSSFGFGSIFVSLPALLSFFIEVFLCIFIGLLVSILRSNLERAERERRQLAVAYEKLQEMQQARDQFVANATHELRTSLTSVSGYLDLLDEHSEILDDETRALFLRYAKEGSNELVSSVNAMLETMRSNAETRPMQLEPVEVAQVVRETMDHLAPQLVRDHPTRVDIDEQVMVYADRQYLRQVIRNLLSNAFKYSPSRSPIIVRAHEVAVEGAPGSSGQICISVEDRGPGIPPTEQSRIFQQFARLERDIEGPVQGTGIGLYTSKQLVEEMGGRIWVESSGEEGSCFCFLLPRASGRAVSEENVMLVSLPSH
ncbi:MAG: HAMP domain-containing histidine kinase [Ktedonobacteraceae bacterium]|nr:HAMP domain-containing histidine kinase [Ktedonobacteraceae bacterium]